MNLQQFLLAKIAEECGEIAKNALKAQQFGLGDAEPGQPFVNAERLCHELDDLFGVIEMLGAVGFFYKPRRASIEEKKNRVIHWLGYSIEVGMVDAQAIVDYKIFLDGAKNKSNKDLRK